MDKDEFVVCDFCSKSVKFKNIRKHKRKIHSSEEKRPKVREAVNNTQIDQNSRRSARLQETFARINQGEYDNEKSLLNFIRNAITHGEFNILKAAKQRLRKKFPSTYRRYIGPINLRDPLGSKNCYCAIASSIDCIAHDILNLTIPKEALQCDACWDLDISYAWGVYGQYGAKKIDTETWRTVCRLRGDKKYATA
ncbi:hypothetical protein [Photobacterium leiognathi]|uniref:hypothetical protein n=1 Tax=Photobacterium leiognathi TaxID=553611 RepID=UPI002982678F|nr:hypothetical protein [Photobacterium leiognathi]